MAQGQEECRDDHVEQRVRVRDLPRHVRCAPRYEVGERRDEREEQGDADHLERGVRGRDPSRFGVLADRGEQRRDRGPDVRAEDDRDRPGERQHARHRE